MALYNSTSVQRLTLRGADCFDELQSTPLILNYDARDGDGFGEIVLHLENAPLALALRDAINETLKRFRANAEPTAEVEVAA